jgi:uncharacterized protein (TIGR02145 family)
MIKQRGLTVILLLSAIVTMITFSVAKAQSIATVKIGAQTWCTKNLDVNTYRNGDPIPQVQDKNEWSKLTTGAWCYYENRSENGTTYGKLYNFYAVQDSRGLAPKGYHIPSDAEWTKLNDFLGGKSSGTKMKSTKGWQDNGNGTNSSGFSGFPGGCRFSSFDFIRSHAYWWSSSENTTNDVMSSGTVWTCVLYFASNTKSRGFGPKTSGYSIRCLRD